MKILIISCFLLLLTSNSFAKKWTINEDHSEIFFSIPYLKVSEVTGRFHQFLGFIEFDGLNKPKNLSVVVKVESIETGNKMRDGHLKGNDFFQKIRFPEILFQSERIKELKHNTYIAIGRLTIKKISRPLQIEFTLSDPINDTWSFKSRFAKFKASIKRSEFDINWNKTISRNEYLLGDEIKFWGTFQIQPLNEKTPDNKHMIPDTAYIRDRERIARGEINDQSAKTELETKFTENSGPVVEKKNAQVSKQLIKDDKKTTLWWSAFFVLGFLGFISVILISIYSKNFLSDFFPTYYKENGYFDYLSDAILIGWVLLYSVSLWVIGWGQ
jgi:polyisoprenoid-binding protein YceI